MPNKIQEAVNIDVLKIEILGRDTAKKTEEHFGRLDPVFGCVDKANTGIQIKHIAIIIVDKDQAPLCIRDCVVRMLKKTFGFAGSLFSENDSNQ